LINFAFLWFFGDCQKSAPVDVLHSLSAILLVGLASLLILGCDVIADVATRFITIDMPWRNFLSPDFGAKVPEGSALILPNVSRLVELTTNIMTPLTLTFIISDSQRLD